MVHSGVLYLDINGTHFDLSHLTRSFMGSSRFWLKVADQDSKNIPHEFPRSHWLKATGQCVIERYLSPQCSGVVVFFAE